VRVRECKMKGAEREVQRKTKCPKRVFANVFSKDVCEQGNASSNRDVMPRLLLRRVRWCGLIAAVVLHILCVIVSVELNGPVDLQEILEG
jgi:hypothetical protein